MGYRYVEHTADVGIEAWGADVAEAFTEAAVALSGLMVDPSAIQERMKRRIEVHADDREDLLVRWLNELIYLFDTERVAFRRFRIERLTATDLAATAWGERVDQGRHEVGTHVKAATFHRLAVDPGPPATARVFLDV